MTRMNKHALGTAGGALGAACIFALLATAPPAGAAGNGISAKPAGQIIRQAISTTKSVKSLTLTGQLVSGGQNISLDVSLGQGRGSGTVSLGANTLDLVEVNNTLYFKGNAAFIQEFAGNTPGASALAGRWIAVPANNPQIAQLSQFVNASALFNGAFSGSTDKGSIATKSGNAKVNGVSAIKITITNPKKPGDDGVAYVATSGPPYILRIVAQGSGTTGQLTLSNFNEPVNAEAPSGAISLPQGSS